MAKRKKAAAPPEKPDPWKQLGELIGAYAEAMVADSWKGGGDPEDHEQIELELRLAHVKLVRHIEVMKREYE